MLSKGQIRMILLYVFKLGRKDVLMKIICPFTSQYPCDFENPEKIVISHYFFENSDPETQTSRMSQFESPVESDPRKTIRDLAELQVSTVAKHLEKPGKVKMDQCAPHIER
ncbi:hypothetical protein COOONC_08906 [Cooperia oncophora]